MFYPDAADTAEERLGYYASRFPIVEVDATYYALPARRTAELWVERTPPDFTFDIKAHALMTGQPTEIKRLPKDLREALPAELADQVADLRQGPARRAPRRGLGAGSRMRLEPLAEAGQLGSILLQYPRWFFTSSENRDTIEDATSRLRDAGLVGAVEFRSASWFNEKNIERTLRFLGDREIPLVVVDGPQGFKSSVPPIVAAPSPDLAIVRFHGRRTRDLGGDRASRRSSASATSTTRASSPTGRRASATSRPRPRTPTSSSTTAMRTTARRTRSSSRGSSRTCRRRLRNGGAEGLEWSGAGLGRPAGDDGFRPGAPDEEQEDPARQR